MKDLRFFMKYSTYAMAAIFSYNGVIVGFAMLLDNVAKISKGHSGSNKFNRFVEAFLSHFH